MPLIDVYLGLGSNIEREAHLCAGLDALHELFGDLNCSPVFESEPVGIRSDCFFNMVVQVKTSMPLQELDQRLKQIEGLNGRYALPRKGLPLDIDVLLYGQQVGVYGSITLPRAEILKNCFCAVAARLIGRTGSASCGAAFLCRVMAAGAHFSAVVADSL